MFQMHILSMGSLDPFTNAQKKVMNVLIGSQYNVEKKNYKAHCIVFYYILKLHSWLP